MPRKSPATDIEAIAELLDASITYSLREICERCGIHADYVVDMVEFGIVEPLGGAEPREWRFSSTTLMRLRRARRLQRDLDLNLAGLAVSLDLLDEVEALRREVADLRRQLQRFYLEE